MTGCHAFVKWKGVETMNEQGQGDRPAEDRPAINDHALASEWLRLDVDVEMIVEPPAEMNVSQAFYDLMKWLDGPFDLYGTKKKPDAPMPP